MIASKTINPKKDDFEVVRFMGARINTSRATRKNAAFAGCIARSSAFELTGSLPENLEDDSISKYKPFMHQKAMSRWKLGLRSNWHDRREGERLSITAWLQ